MKTFLSAAAAALVAAGLALAADVKSGPQAGQKVPGPFHPLNVTGEHAGEKNCLFCQNGESPVAMIFARDNSPELAKLIKKIDAATLANKPANMGSFVVFLSDKEGLDKQLKAMADKEGIKTCVLSIDNPAGPKGYNVSEKADVTVVLYVDRTVKANYAFEKGKLTDKDIDTVVADVSKIVPKK
jgi:hypothetical protein